MMDQIWYSAIFDDLRDDQTVTSVVVPHQIISMEVIHEGYEKRNNATVGEELILFLDEWILYKTKHKLQSHLYNWFRLPKGQRKATNSHPQSPYNQTNCRFHWTAAKTKHTA